MKSALFFDVARGLGFLAMGYCMTIGFFRFKSMTVDQRIILLLVMFSFSAETLALILWYYRRNNNFIYHFYVLVETTLLIMLYKRNLRDVIRPLYMEVALLIFLVFSIINTVFWQALNQFNTNVTLAEGVLLIMLSVAYLLYLIRVPAISLKGLLSTPMFWANIAVLTYFSGSLVLLNIVNDLASLPERQRIFIWGVNAAFNVLHYVLFAFALRAQNTA